MAVSFSSADGFARSRQATRASLITYLQVPRRCSGERLPDFVTTRLSPKSLHQLLCPAQSFATRRTPRFFAVLCRSLARGCRSNLFHCFGTSNGPLEFLRRVRLPSPRQQRIPISFWTTCDGCPSQKAAS